MSINRWSEIGQQAAQAKEVYIQNQVVKIFSMSPLKQEGVNASGN